MRNQPQHRTAAVLLPFLERGALLKEIEIVGFPLGHSAETITAKDTASLLAAYAKDKNTTLSVDADSKTGTVIIGLVLVVHNRTELREAAETLRARVQDCLGLSTIIIN